METVAAQDARQSGLGNRRQEEADLGVGAALAAQSEDLFFELRGSLAGLVARGRGAVIEARGRAGLAGAPEPLADGLFADAESGGGSTQRATLGEMKPDHFCSRARSQSGISVHVVRAAWREVECASTTSLLCASRADNLLKHDT
jgi:hypothetical protein